MSDPTTVKTPHGRFRIIVWTSRGDYVLEIHTPIGWVPVSDETESFSALWHAAARRGLTASAFGLLWEGRERTRYLVEPSTTSRARRVWEGADPARLPEAARLMSIGYQVGLTPDELAAVRRWLVTVGDPRFQTICVTHHSINERMPS